MVSNSEIFLFFHSSHRCPISGPHIPCLDYSLPMVHVPFCSSTNLPVYACVCVCVYVCVRACTHTHTLSHSVLSDFAIPWTIACQAPLYLEFPKQEYWSGLHLLFQGIFPTQGSNPHLQCLLYWQEDSLPLSYLGSCTIQ